MTVSHYEFPRIVLYTFVDTEWNSFKKTGKTFGTQI